MDKEKILKSLPHQPGVYLFKDHAGKILYIGKAVDLAKRVAHYFGPGASGPGASGPRTADFKIQALTGSLRQVDYLPCLSEREALIAERRLIRKFQPPFNILWRDDKSYPYIALTLQEDFPRIFLTRKKQKDGAAYFGPYPKAGSVQNLLSFLWRRKFFPLRPCDWKFSEKKPLDPKKIQACLYYHTGECPAPCAGKISGSEYRKIAQKARLFLEGKFERLQEMLRRQMRGASRDMRYEQAAQLRDHLRAMEHLAERVCLRRITEKDLEQSLSKSRALTELQQTLGLAQAPLHIEAFDISNLFGSQAVGSMVCFKNGLPFKNHYRRFKIRTVSQMDDFAMMREVVGRRYRNALEKSEDLPDLIVVDGGRGQLSAAMEALNALEGLKKVPPTLGLAKEKEEIYRPQTTRPLQIPRDSPALHVLQHLRDEAHRFAITYHKLLRKKSLGLY
ncbi:MAG: excinuclease ABC subunit UvrC [Elusimicrobia bacterium]|nr:excinuclease ABC subunit UvrC [Elusimicrobiota bacterium]